MYSEDDVKHEWSLGTGHPIVKDLGSEKDLDRLVHSVAYLP